MIELFVTRIPVLVVMWLSLTVHEWAHARAAYALGDDTARAQGRMSLDPLVHLDFVGSVVLPIVGVPFGWARPVPLNPARFSRSLPMTLGVALAAAAGPISNLVLAAGAFSVVVAIAAFAHDLYDGPLAVFAWLTLRVNLLLAVFNLLPIPPLDGSRLVNHLLPRSLHGAWERFERFGPVLPFTVLVLLVALGLNPFAFLDELVLGLAGLATALVGGGR